MSLYGRSFCSAGGKHAETTKPARVDGRDSSTLSEGKEIREEDLAGWSDIAWMRKYDLIIAHWDVVIPRCPYPWHPIGYLAWQYTANMNGYLYGFHATVLGKTAPRICMENM